MSTPPKHQFSMRTVFLLVLFVALTLRLLMVQRRHAELLYDTSAIGETGRPVAELRTRLGDLDLDDLDKSNQYFVPIPTRQTNRRSFRLYFPKTDKARLLKLGMSKTGVFG